MDHEFGHLLLNKFSKPKRVALIRKMGAAITRRSEQAGADFKTYVSKNLSRCALGAGELPAELFAKARGDAGTLAEEILKEVDLYA